MASEKYAYTPPKQKNFYTLLGVEPNSTQKEIKLAFIGKSKELHPDKNVDDPNSHYAFIEIQEAYNILSDAATRSAYDRRINPEAYVKRASTYSTRYTKNSMNPNKVWTEANEAEKMKQMNYDNLPPFHRRERYEANYKFNNHTNEQVMTKANTSLTFGLKIFALMLCFYGVVSLSNIPGLRVANPATYYRKKAEKYRLSQAEHKKRMGEQFHDQIGKFIGL